MSDDEKNNIFSIFPNSNSKEDEEKKEKNKGIFNSVESYKDYQDSILDKIQDPTKIKHMVNIIAFEGEDEDGEEYIISTNSYNADFEKLCGMMESAKFRILHSVWGG